MGRRTPGRLGESQTIHAFSMVAKKTDREEKILTPDLLADEPPLNQLIMLYARAIDIKPASKMLASVDTLGIRE